MKTGDYIIYVGDLIVSHCNYPTIISFPLQPPSPKTTNGHPKKITTSYENHNQIGGDFLNFQRRWSEVVTGGGGGGGWGGRERCYDNCNEKN